MIISSLDNKQLDAEMNILNFDSVESQCWRADGI